jgi:hypothetical protein
MVKIYPIKRILTNAAVREQPDQYDYYIQTNDIYRLPSGGYQEIKNKKHQEL